MEVKFWAMKCAWKGMRTDIWWKYLKKIKFGSPTKELKDNINMTVINMHCRYKWHMFVLRGIWKIILLAVWEIVFSY
jgi:hypothetical protein